MNSTLHVPAVVVGVEAGGLGVVRSLGQAGVPVIAIDQDPRRPGMATRYARRKVILPIRALGLIDGLIDLAKSLPEPPVLIATLRLPLLLISAHRERLLPFYRLSLPAHNAVVALENKELLLSAAADAGIPVPQTLILGDETSLEAAALLRYPVILKPTDNDPNYMSRFKKAYMLKDHAALRVRVREIWPYYGQLVVQEWIPGNDDALYFCLQYRDHQGQVRGSFSGRKLLSWPPGTGATAACCAAPEYQHELEALAARLFNPLRLAGFCSVEFKRHPVSGEFFLIEPTIGRTDQQEEVATLNGVNLPLVGYCDQIGHPPPVQKNTRTNHVWAHPTSTRWAQQWLVERGQSAQPVRVPGARTHDALFRWRDPAPALLDRWQGLQRAVKARLRTN